MQVAYFSGLINKSKHNPTFFSHNISQPLNPVYSGFPTTLSDDCEMFLNFLNGKIDGLRANIHHVDHHSNHLTCLVRLSELNPISMYDLLDLVTHICFHPPPLT